MKTIKIIDLFNKIVNGEEVPKKIKKTWVYEWSFDEVRGDFSYITKEGCRFDSDWLVLEMLDDEVEIIEEEEKEIETIDMSSPISVVHCAMKINELIDAVKELKRDK